MIDSCRLSLTCEPLPNYYSVTQHVSICPDKPCISSLRKKAGTIFIQATEDKFSIKLTFFLHAFFSMYFLPLDHNCINFYFYFCLPGKCFAGTFLNTTNLCEPCPVGQYQDIDLQTSCKLCSGNRTTRATGANSSDLCVCKYGIWNIVKYESSCHFSIIVPLI
jgi:hypothetical protein